MDLIGTFSSNTFKFRITPSPTNNAEKSFVKRIDHFSFVRTCDKLMEMYPFIMAYAKQHETAHLLQEHEYCGKMGNKVEDGVQREWLATKWVEGKSLEKINVEGQKIEWPGRDAEETFRLVRQLFQAMAAFHCVGFQHGDLHSNNISIDTQNNIRIIDYDLAGRIPNDWAKSTEKGHMVQAIKILLGLHQKFWQSEEFRRLYSYNTHPIQPRCKKGDENVERMECFLSNLESYIGFSVLDGRPKYCKLFEKGDLTVEKMFHAKCFTHVRET
jgi:serine/threonine protein kinase